MLALKFFLISVIIIAIAFFFLAVSILFKKKGRFPNFHIGSNKEMVKRGIVCAKTFDRQEQQKVKHLLLKKLKIDPGAYKTERGCPKKIEDAIANEVNQSLRFDNQ